MRRSIIPGHPSDRLKDTPVSKRLRKQGIDTGFLIWLEGEADRLPRVSAIRHLTGEQLASAIWAAGWLRDASLTPDLEAAYRSDAWEQRYRVLESFLFAALGLRRTFRIPKLHEDLQALEAVLEALLPPSSREKYVEDIRYLRLHKHPSDVLRTLRGPRKKTGGKPESEQTRRMRAAVTYLRPLSPRPFVDLTDFWNESLASQVYGEDEIKQRIRRKESITEDATFWKGIYRLQRAALYQTFPGPFPWSEELRKLYRSRTGEATPWD
jgi:hypothetical protein